MFPAFHGSSGGRGEGATLSSRETCDDRERLVRITEDERVERSGLLDAGPVAEAEPPAKDLVAEVLDSLRRGGGQDRAERHLLPLHVEHVEALARAEIYEGFEGRWNRELREELKREVEQLTRRFAKQRDEELSRRFVASLEHCARGVNPDVLVRVLEGSGDARERLLVVRSQEDSDHRLDDERIRIAEHLREDFSPSRSEVNQDLADGLEVIPDAQELAEVLGGRLREGAHEVEDRISLRELRVFLEVLGEDGQRLLVVEGRRHVAQRGALTVRK